MQSTYIEDIERQNDELLERLSKAETMIRKINRHKGVYPVFKLIRRKLSPRRWILDCEYLTNCDNVKIIIPTIKYTVKYHMTIDGGDLIGFQYWRQSMNYRWALSATSRFLDMNLLRVPGINVIATTGNIRYSPY